MFCDSNGRPDPNGDYELVNGTICLRDGRQIGTSTIMFMDAALRGRTSLTDAERRVAKDKAMRDWAMRHAWMANPLPFTAADEAAAIEAATQDKAARPARAEMMADTASTQTAREAAHQARKIAISTAWMR